MENIPNIRKELFILKLSVVVLTMICLALFLFMWKRDSFFSQEHFGEINVERINIVEKDGKLRFVLSNKMRQHPGVIDGIVFNERQGTRPPGFIFFNDKGDEAGGFIFAGDTDSERFAGLLFDAFRSDETVKLVYHEQKDGKTRGGLLVHDRPMLIKDYLDRVDEIKKMTNAEEKASAVKDLRENSYYNRLKLMKDYDGAALLKLGDGKGKTRIELKVEANGSAFLNFLDDNGKIIYSLPPK